MKKIWKEIGLAALFGIAVPGLLLAAAVQGNSASPPATEPTGSTQGVEEPRGSAVVLPIILPDGSRTDMELETYIVGVLMGEIPADFEPEAQKAQAVAARTFTLKTHTQGTKHPGGAVCTDSTCCQSYCAPEDYLAEGGSEEKLNRVREAVAATRGQVLTYGDKLIEATYFSCSGGRTEDAAAVWGAEIPYLIATDSPGEEKASHYTDTVTFTAKDFAARLGISPTGQPALWLGKVQRTDGGGVAEMEIGGKVFSGTTLRQKLGLRSTAFVMTAAGEEIIVTTRGFGHRVGMSQYGADAMAVTGSSYTEILAHYYPGTALVSYSAE